MIPFDECFVLLPASTLEDFPADASPADARNLLAAWTVLWHPRLLAATKQSPAWYRADSPPAPQPNRLVVVPTLSLARLPEDYEAQCRETQDCVWLSAPSRHEMLALLGLGPADSTPIAGAYRSIGPDDFFAFGYAMLQVQVMTRRLRYTSNLDQIHVQKRIVASAEAYLAGDATTAIERMHDAFDALAEERDHYFSTDPSLVDLTLTTPATLAAATQAMQATALAEFVAEPVGYASENETPGINATPVNVLLDGDAIESLAASLNASPASTSTADSPSAAELLRWIRSGQIGWAAGGPASQHCFDLLSFGESEKLLREAFARAEAVVGTAPPVYARLAGSTPSDLTRTLVELGYAGMIPISFASGTGFGDEAKVTRREGGAEIHALTAKPIDAAHDPSFLTLATRLGEAVDSGEIATGLFAHWPGNVCDSFLDLRRTASWSLALGRFWRLDRYFTDGDHPYHHAAGRSQCPEVPETLRDLVLKQAPNPISSRVRATRESAVRARDAMTRGLLSLVHQYTAKGKDERVTTEEVARCLGAVSVITPAQGMNDAVLVMNPHAVASRQSVELGSPVADDEHIFASSREGDLEHVQVDTPPFGFAIAQSQESLHAPELSGKAKRSKGSASWLPAILRSKPKPIASPARLQNEFMEVEIDEKSGGVKGVYSGAVRGNRLSIRLVSSEADTSMRCDRLTINHDGAANGSLEASGAILDKNAHPVATFTIEYSLERGSRLLKVCGEIKPTGSFGSDPWRSYLGVRTAVASDAGNVRMILRDKLHRATGRRWVGPLGLVIDEGDRSTLVASLGLAYHKRVDERFVDTLVLVAGESSHRFEMQYGFDVAQPVEVAKSLVAGPWVQPIAPPGSAASSAMPSRGWLMHVAPKDASVLALRPHRRSDNRLAMVVRLLRTGSTGGQTTLRFCRDVLFADVVSFKENVSALEFWERPLESERKGQLSFEGDTVKVSLSGHQIVDVYIVFL